MNRKGNEVVIVQRIFPEYQKLIFDAIYKEIRFTLLHSRDSSGIKQTLSPYATAIKKWKYGKGDTHLFLNVFSYIKRNKPKVVIHEFAVGILSLPFIVLAKKIWGYKLIIWGHTYNRKIGFDPRKHFSDKYRLWLQKRADAIITYSMGEKEELIRHNIDSNKIFPALNTVDTSKYLPIRDKLEKIGKEEIKRELGLKHRFNLVFIGRLYEDKWPQYAIEVVKFLLEKKSLSIALHFVGTGKIERALIEFCRINDLQNNVFFHGEVYDEYKTGQFLFASDIMIMPGCVGLSVNHAFCFDCPVITFEPNDSVPAHGPEVEYVVNEKTGFVVKHRSIEDMTEKIFDYLNNDSLQRNMKMQIRHMIEHVCPVEKLISEVVNAIDYVKK